MTESFFFYDLETSGINPRESRVMQFAGQRTDLNLKPIGNPFNVLIRLTEDCLPDPQAILLTGITPQQTVTDGISEADFLDIFHKEISTPGTIFVGFNNVRFDDEFIRFLLYRNLYEPYGWQWQDSRSRWDLLDVVRMTRALRPEGIVWPKDAKGVATNRLELLAEANKLLHVKAHDAMSDVEATIALAKLIKEKQPKLFSYLKNLRNKKAIAEVVEKADPMFVYTSGKYPSEYEKTTVVMKIANHPDRQGALVYDLRHNPKEFTDLSVEELVAAWQRPRDEEGPRLPVKSLKFNRCPAVAPLSVMLPGDYKRLQLSKKSLTANAKQLLGNKEFHDRLLEALHAMDVKREQSSKGAHRISLVDSQLYDRFIPDEDRKTMNDFHSLESADLNKQSIHFQDKRLNELLPLYIARNFPSSLTDEQRQEWEEYRRKKLLFGNENSVVARYFSQLQILSQSSTMTKDQRFLLEELQLWGESIIPEIDVETP